MLPANVISALQAFSNAERPLPTIAKDIPQPINKLEPGQQLQGAVQSKISEGIFKVQVAGQTLQMRLPGNIQSGDTIKLQVVSLQPRVTFDIVASTKPDSANPAPNDLAPNNLTSNNSVSVTQQLGSAANKLEVGQQLQGAVQSQVSEGVFKVQVAGQTLQLRLPGNVQSGDTIKLQVVSLQPRITFGMVASTNPISTPEQIGSAARLLANLADLPLERPIVQQLGDKAVWPAMEQAPDPKKLAGALQEALGKSGLFYESHQAQWIRGERSTNQLLEEPQNTLKLNNLPSSPVNLDSKADTHTSTQMRAGAPPAAISADDTSPPITKELIPLVQQQLHTLEQHHMIWMGQVWPGQQMQWEIQGESKHQRQQRDERQWSTEMELALPKLGGIQAHLAFAEGGLRLTLRAADSTTVDLFNRSLSSLRNSLEDAGISLAAAMVEKS